MLPTELGIISYEFWWDLLSWLSAVISYITPHYHWWVAGKPVRVREIHSSIMCHYCIYRLYNVIGVAQEPCGQHIPMSSKNIWRGQDIPPDHPLFRTPVQIVMHFGEISTFLFPSVPGQTSERWTTKFNIAVYYITLSSASMRECWREKTRIALVCANIALSLSLTGLLRLFSLYIRLLMYTAIKVFYIDPILPPVQLPCQSLSLHCTRKVPF